MIVHHDKTLTGAEPLFRRLSEEARQLSAVDRLVLRNLEPANDVDHGRFWLHNYGLHLVAQHAGSGFYITQACYGCGGSLLYTLKTDGTPVGSCSKCGPVATAWSTLVLDAGRENRGMEKMLQLLLLTGAADPLTATVAASELINFFMAWREAYWELAAQV